MLAWWHYGCPDILTAKTEWQSLSGMRTTDYANYKAQIEPLLVKSFEILTKCRKKQQAITEARLINLRKAVSKRDRNKHERQKQITHTEGIVDKIHITGVTPINPPQKNFHEGWNLNKRKPAVKSKAYTPLLLDK